MPGHVEARHAADACAWRPIADAEAARQTTTEDRTALAKERVERDEEDLVRLYLTDIGQYPLLTKDDEVRLAQAIERRGEAETEIAAGGKTLTAGAPA